MLFFAKNFSYAQKYLFKYERVYIFHHLEKDLALLKWPIAIVVMHCIPLPSYDCEENWGTEIVVDNKRGYQAMARKVNCF